MKGMKSGGRLRSRSRSRSRSPSPSSRSSQQVRFETKREGRPTRPAAENGHEQRGRKIEKSKDSDRIVWGNVGKEEEEEAAAAEKMEKLQQEREKANFGLTGALAKDERTGNLLNGVLLKFTEPLDAAKPTKLWRIYIFKGEEILDVKHVHRNSVFLFGRDERIADFHLAHPSCSKQHAVLQFRAKEKKDDTGKITRVVKPYIMDLGSPHKTFLNGSAIEDARYYELLEKDCLKFGGSSREYVLLHDDSA